MLQLSREHFDSARSFMNNQARSLERALFQHRFENAPADAILVELADFQNPDGGFGRALEPDMRSPSSSALATEIGLRTFVELGVPSKHPMVRAALDYLQNSIDHDKKTWRVAPLDVNKYPHAPWWHDDGTSLSRTFGDYKIIPRAGILASLYHYFESLPDGWLSILTEDTINCIVDLESDGYSGGGDAIVYAQRLAQAPGLPERLATPLIEHLCNIADQIVSRDQKSWTQYCTPPLKLAPEPDSIAADKLSDCLPTHLDYLIESQHPDGYWDVTWSWNDYPEDWEIAKSEWRGILVLEALNSLSAFGRIGQL